MRRQTTLKPRVPKRNPEKTRARILQCATKLFARSGYLGTSLSQIIEKARVNKRMVYHYYGSKEGLYRAVHIHQWQVLAEWFAQELVPTPSDELARGVSRELLTKALEIFHEFSATHQDFLRLLMWDGLEGGKVSRSIWKDIRGPLYQRMEALVVGAQAEGWIPADLKPSHFVVSFMGAILLYFANAGSMKEIFGEDPLSERAIKRRRDQVLTLFHKVIKP